MVPVAISGSPAVGRDSHRIPPHQQEKRALSHLVFLPSPRAPAAGTREGFRPVPAWEVNSRPGGERGEDGVLPALRTGSSGPQQWLDEVSKRSNDKAGGTQKRRGSSARPPSPSERGQSPSWGQGASSTLQHWLHPRGKAQGFLPPTFRFQRGA